jgi:hypothetical protein
MLSIMSSCFAGRPRKSTWVVLSVLLIAFSSRAAADTEVQDPEVYVPPTSYPVSVPEPRCQGQVQDANAPVKAMLTKYGAVLSQAPDPDASIVGYRAVVVGQTMPNNSTQNYANCAAPCITLPKTAHIDSVNMVWRFESPGDPTA